MPCPNRGINGDRQRIMVPLPVNERRYLGNLSSKGMLYFAIPDARWTVRRAAPPDRATDCAAPCWSGARLAAHRFLGALLTATLVVRSSLAFEIPLQAGDAEERPWTFDQVILDQAPLANDRINDLAIGDINGNDQLDVWPQRRTGRGGERDGSPI